MPGSGLGNLVLCGRILYKPIFHLRNSHVFMPMMRWGHLWQFLSGNLLRGLSLCIMAAGPFCWLQPLLS